MRIRSSVAHLRSAAAVPGARVRRRIGRGGANGHGVRDRLRPAPARLWPDRRPVRQVSRRHDRDHRLRVDDARLRGRADAARPRGGARVRRRDGRCADSVVARLDRGRRRVRAAPECPGALPDRADVRHSARPGARRHRRRPLRGGTGLPRARRVVRRRGGVDGEVRARERGSRAPRRARRRAPVPRGARRALVARRPAHRVRRRTAAGRRAGVRADASSPGLRPAAHRSGRDRHALRRGRLRLRGALAGAGATARRAGPRGPGAACC